MMAVADWQPAHSLENQPSQSKSGQVVTLFLSSIHTTGHHIIYMSLYQTMKHFSKGPNHLNRHHNLFFDEEID